VNQWLVRATTLLTALAMLTKPTGKARDMAADGGREGAVPEPASARAQFLLGLYLAGLMIFVFYALVATWPVVVKVADAGSPTAEFEAFDFLWSNGVKATADRRLFFTVVAAGALGSLIHTLTSFGDYVGNGQLSRRWIWWFILRTPIGVGLALVFYLLLRGGLLLPSLPTSGNGQEIDVNLLLNPYGLAAISGLGGMFSRQATDKLRELFDNLFRTERPVARSAPLSGGGPTIFSATPPQLAVGSGLSAVTLAGENFQEGCTATVNGHPRAVTRESDTRVTVALVPAADLAQAGTLQLVVTNPGPAGGSSGAFALKVE
jgi:hypothetical protein